MASKGKESPRDLAIKGLLKRARERPHAHDLWGAIVSLEDSEIVTPDRLRDTTTILVMSGAVEQVLEQAITTHFVADESYNASLFDDQQGAPLSTFAAKIRIGRALGIYGKATKEELDILRHIRNLVAHAKFPVDFSSTEIAEACLHLQMPEKFPLELKPTTARERFASSARLIFLYLEDPEAPKPFRYASHSVGHMFS